MGPLDLHWLKPTVHVLHTAPQLDISINTPSLMLDLQSVDVRRNIVSFWTCNKLLNFVRNVVNLFKLADHSERWKTSITKTIQLYCFLLSETLSQMYCITVKVTSNIIQAEAVFIYT